MTSHFSLWLTWMGGDSLEKEVKWETLVTTLRNSVHERGASGSLRRGGTDNQF